MALLFVPVALGGILLLLGAPGSRAPLWDVLLSGALIAADLFCFGRVAEASKRIAALREDPNADVRPLPAPFQASLFGPYH